jgi:hypothetical protein
MGSGRFDPLILDEIARKEQIQNRSHSKQGNEQSKEEVADEPKTHKRRFFPKNFSNAEEGTNDFNPPYVLS